MAAYIQKQLYILLMFHVNLTHVTSELLPPCAPLLLSTLNVTVCTVIFVMPRRCLVMN